MSTYQPPGGQQPEGTPGYTEPQDPWAGGYEPGLASVPTDPIPQQHDPYASYPPGDVWSQQTAAQGGYAYVPQPQRSKAGMIVLVALLVLVLGGGGGFGAWYFTTQRNATPVDDPTGDPNTSAPTPENTAPTAFEPGTAKEGDCIVNRGTTALPQIELADCDTDGSYTIIKIVTGAEIPENDEGRFDDKTTSVAMCEGTNYQSWYGYQDGVTDDKDVFFCMTNN